VSGFIPQEDIVKKEMSGSSWNKNVMEKHAVILDELLKRMSMFWSKKTEAILILLTFYEGIVIILMFLKLQDIYSIPIVTFIKKNTFIFSWMDLLLETGPIKNQLWEVLLIHLLIKYLSVSYILA
jgi:hypothetical protein